MKKLYFASLLCLLLGGCANHYDVTLYNGATFRTRSKPVLDKERGVYVYKDAQGRQMWISALRVRQIEAVRAGSKPKTFNAFEDFKGW